MINSTDYFEQSNDNTFNVVLKQQCYEHDKYLIIVKTGGMITADSISKPTFVVLTNLLTGQRDRFEYDTYHACITAAQAMSDGNKLSTRTTTDIKKMLQDTFGRYVVLSKHNRTKLYQSIKDQIDGLDLSTLSVCVEDPQRLIDTMHKKLVIADTMTMLDLNRSNYTYGIKQLDSLLHTVRKLPCYKQDAQLQKLAMTINVLINYLPRYE